MRLVKRWAHPAFIGAAFAAGLAIRYSLQTHVSGDAREYLLPWYRFVHEHGLGSLRVPFTNYTPYFTYLLLGLTQLEALATPLALIKAVSAIFELGCAVIAARIVRMAGGGRWAVALGFAGIWLAPTVLLNGPFWAQADSIWTFFILCSLVLFLQGRNGIPSFAIAFAVKSQAVFFGPFMLGMIFRRRVLWFWLAAIPAVYLLLALPVLLAGRPVHGVLSIYLDQTKTYHALSANAANFWIFGAVNETAGVIIGLTLAAIAGLILAVLTARVSPGDHEGLLVAACASLLIMPFLLPKMHDRYFYAFEVAAIALASINPRYIGLAVMAQANGVLSYMMFDERLPLEILTPAALCNAGMAGLLLAQMAGPLPGRQSSHSIVAAFAVAAVALVSNVMMAPPQRGFVGWYPAYATAFCVAGALLLFDIWRGGARPGKERQGKEDEAVPD